MRNKLIGRWFWLILGLLVGLAACTHPAVTPATAPTAVLAVPTATPDPSGLHFYEFYSPM